jgi:hypothetical protein
MYNFDKEHLAVRKAQLINLAQSVTALMKWEPYCLCVMAVNYCMKAAVQVRSAKLYCIPEGRHFITGKSGVVREHCHGLPAV